MVVVRTGGTTVAPWWPHPTTTFAPAIRHLAWSIQRVCHPHRGICPVLCFFIHIDSSIQKMIIRRTRDPNVPLNRLFWFCFIVYTSEGLDWTPFKLLRRNFWNVSFVPPPFAAAPPAIEMEHLLAQRGAAATLYTCALYFIVRLLPNTLLAQRGAAFGSFYFYYDGRPCACALMWTSFNLNTALPQCSARITRTSLISQCWVHGYGLSSVRPYVTVAIIYFIHFCSFQRFIFVDKSKRM